MSNHREAKSTKTGRNDLAIGTVKGGDSASLARVFKSEDLRIEGSSCTFAKGDRASLEANVGGSTEASRFRSVSSIKTSSE